MRKLLFAICFFTVTTLGGTEAALAHAFLDHANPAVGAKLTAPPPSLVLTFTEPLEGDQYEIVVLDGAGHRLASNADKGASLNFDTITIPLPKLAVGAYRVTWRVNPGPGHETSGDYHFQVVSGH